MPKRPRKNKEFWKAVYNILERYPPKRKTVVTLGGIPDYPHESYKDTCYGLAWRDGSQFKVWVHDFGLFDQDVALWCHVTMFLHEYAHVMAWSHLDDIPEYPHAHDEIWGVWHSRLYRYYFAEK